MMKHVLTRDIYIFPSQGDISVTYKLINKRYMAGHTYTYNKQ